LCAADASSKFINVNQIFIAFWGKRKEKTIIVIINIAPPRVHHVNIIGERRKQKKKINLYFSKNFSTIVTVVTSSSAECILSRKLFSARN
jgi:hypothetical protein